MLNDWNAFTVESRTSQGGEAPYSISLLAWNQTTLP